MSVAASPEHSEGAPKTFQKSPRPADKILGQRLRELRLTRGITQEQVADHLDLTFQQVQKYENGSNRVSATRLKVIAEFLGYSLLDFFPDTEQHKPAATVLPARAYDIAVKWAGMSNPRARTAFADLIDGVAAGAFVSEPERV